LKANGSLATQEAENSQVLVPHTTGQGYTLTSLIDPAFLQELQDGFCAISRLRIRIADAEGQPITNASFEREENSGTLQIIGQMLERAIGLTYARPYAAPIVVEGQTLGVVQTETGEDAYVGLQDAALLLQKLGEIGVAQKWHGKILAAAQDAAAPTPQQIQRAVNELANHIAHVCDQAMQLRVRIEELGTLNRLTTLLTGQSDLQHRLDVAVRSLVSVMNLKAACIRLLDDDKTQLKIAASYNLSGAYIKESVVPLDKSPVMRQALEGEMVYIKDLATDSRIVYPTKVDREGLASSLICGMIYRGKPIGTLQVYSGEVYHFSRYEMTMLQSLSQLIGSAIENALLDRQRQESKRMREQLHMAADVQRRMLPSRMPEVSPFEIAARYVPCFELGGDFYDFFDHQTRLAVTIGDVVGKGIAASLLMASTRSMIRATAENVVEIDRMMSIVNRAIYHDTLPNEFVTLFYGELDPKAVRLTYCSAGHEPPLLLRNGKIYKLDVGGMVLGIDPDQTFDRGTVNLRPGDLLFLYTDGLIDAQNFENEKFGRDRLMKAIHECEKLTAQQSVNQVLWLMRRFVGMKRPVDDTSLVVVRVLPDAVQNTSGRDDMAR
jgi:serine phosphatase RsbU (regulator of sigma subunit)